MLAPSAGDCKCFFAGRGGKGEELGAGNGAAVWRGGKREAAGCVGQKKGRRGSGGVAAWWIEGAEPVRKIVLAADAWGRIGRGLF